MRGWLLPVFIFLAHLINGAEPQVKFSDVAPLIGKKCVSCHSANGMAPFPLETYDEIYRKRKMISVVVENQMMPPWLPDQHYRAFLGQEKLSPEERGMILKWVKEGCPKDNEDPDSRYYTLRDKPKIVLSQPDTSVCMSGRFTIRGYDELERIFYLFSTGTDTLRANGIAFRIGNPSLLHHALIYLADVDTARDYSDFSFLSDDRFKGFLPGFLPGFQYSLYPANAYVPIPPQTDVFLQMHYVPLGVNQSDSSCVDIYFAKETASRPVKILSLNEEDMQEPLAIAAEEVRTFTITKTLTADIKPVSIMPHVHRRCTGLVAQAITPEGRSIPLILISRWNYNFQSYNRFIDDVIIPAGSEIIYTVTFDNTSSNPANPYHPAQAVSQGAGSKDEMMQLVIEYIDP